MNNAVGYAEDHYRFIPKFPLLPLTIYVLLWQIVLLTLLPVGL